MKELFGFIAVALAFACYAPYIWDTLRGSTRPHLFTYLIWALVSALAFFGQLAAGAGSGAWTTGVMALLAVVVLGLSFTHGTKDVTALDVVFLLVAFVALIAWYLTSDPALSVTLATAVDVCAFIPTIRKTLRAPESEHLWSWILNVLRNSASLLALASFTFVTAVYPASLLLMSIVVVFVIVRGRASAS
jgi:hypothetical protein